MAARDCITLRSMQPQSQTLRIRIKMTHRVKLGWLATIVWIVLWGFLLYSDWCSATKMTFNEWGDFFAGASAPLAFLWLVIGYFQQGEELGQNTKALEQQERALQLQVDELKQSVEQQKEMVKVTQQDLDINRSNIERQYQKEKLMAQPQIRPAGGGSSNHQGFVRHTVKANNIGHLINRLEITLINNPEYLKLVNTFHDNWDYQAEKRLQFEVYGTNRLTENDKFEMHLRYVDGLGEESEQTLYCSGNRSGGIVFSSEPSNV